ncbi:MAG: transglutaminase domain-containing protein [Clostridiales bacterium]|nr:transglutaminase domain-containing protein [Clostridiales bacterium]
MNKKTMPVSLALIFTLILTSCSNAQTKEAVTTPASTETTTVTSSVETSETSAPETSSTSETTAAPSFETKAPHEGYNFNPYVLSDMYVESFGEEFKEDYFAFCNAVLTGQDSVALKDKENFDRCRYAIRYCLPVADSYVGYPEADQADNKDGTFKLEYTIPKEEIGPRIDAFIARVEELINSTVEEDDTPLEKTLALYMATATRIDYDYDAVEADPNEPSDRTTGPYHAIMEDMGICQEIAGAYAYLLLQVGIDATTCSGLTHDMEWGHEWAIVKVGDKYYHCDPTSQTLEKNNLKYFGMTNAQREKMGDYNPKTFFIGLSNETTDLYLPITDETLKPLWKSKSVKIDREKDMLYCYKKDDAKGKPYFKMSLK